MIGIFAPVCEICGCLGPKHCGHCQYANYCSREHQLDDWKLGHSENCKKICAWKKENGLENSTQKPDNLPSFKKYTSTFLFKEMEIVTEPEPLKDEGK